MSQDLLWKELAARFVVAMELVELHEQDLVKAVEALAKNTQTHVEQCNEIHRRLEQRINRIMETVQ